MHAARCVVFVLWSLVPACSRPFWRVCAVLKVFLVAAVVGAPAEFSRRI